MKGDKTMENIKVGIIGIGNMGSFHCTCIARGDIDGLTLVAVADRKEARRIWVKENLSENVAVFDDGDKLIESGVCDAIVVATPHYDHPRLVISSLQHDMHVLCEKPAGVYTKQVREMNEVAEKSDKVFALMYNQRTNHVYRKMQEMIQNGIYGEMKRVNWIITDWYRTQTYYNSGEWRATWDGEGGGVLLNQCPHQLDLLQWICGMPCKVQAFTHEGKWHDIEVEDDVTAYLEYPNGATGVFVTTTGDTPGTNRLEVSLTKGKMICEYNDLKVTELEQDEREFCYTSPQGFGGPASHEVPIETDGKNPQHAGVFQAWADCMRFGKPLVADGKDGINGLMLSNAMHLSSWLGRPVELPVDEELYLEELSKKRAASKAKKTVTETILGTEGSFGIK